MTERKLLALALAATMSIAFLTGMGTYGFLTDSESARISLSGNIAGNQAANTPTPTPTSATALGPSSAGTENPDAELETDDTYTPTLTNTSGTPTLTNTSDTPTRGGEKRTTEDESGTSPTTDTTSTRPTESSENQDGGVGAGNDDDGGPEALLPTDPGGIDLLVTGRDR
ncbi:hypothetical protein [Halorhabdus amylolytica]|uniref:hypothetical protein n=1 Tax=Halorhabdus amylolytica TaxID=2559573 RepID=UPI0010AAE995|nr:hypothetical protein [Halorhabdus amylolytica]